MSFAKAKRFHYKDPDLQVSPADYYISTSLHKSCTIAKCPRFLTKNEEPSSSFCSRLTCKCNKISESRSDLSGYSRSCCKIGPSQASSTPRCKNLHPNPSDISKIKERIVKLNREELRRLSLPSHSRVSEGKKKRVKDLVNKYENLPNIWTSDDDYHSYTSSDDIDIIESFKSNGNRNLDGRRRFEEIVIEKIDNIKHNIDKFQKNLTEIQQNLSNNKSDMKSTSCLQKYPKSRNRPYDSSDDLNCIIFDAIENIRKEFECRQHTILSDVIQKLKNLSREIYVCKLRSSEDLRDRCDATASDLYKEVIEYIEKNDTIEYQTSHDYEVTLAEDSDDMDLVEEKDFNYENICRILSDHLQISQRELESLKSEKNNISVKCGSTEEKLNAQTSAIDMLYEEIEELKRNS